MDTITEEECFSQRSMVFVSMACAISKEELNTRKQ